MVVGFIVIVAIYNAQRDDAEIARQAALTPEQRAVEAAEQSKVDRVQTARYACKHALKEALNDPDSASGKRHVTDTSKNERTGRYSSNPRDARRMPSAHTCKGCGIALLSYRVITPA